MAPIVLTMIVFIICYIMDFPGGPTGFGACVKGQLKQKGLACKSKSLKE